jgi:hypothetical protein
MKTSRPLIASICNKNKNKNKESLPDDEDRKRLRNASFVPRIEAAADRF